MLLLALACAVGLQAEAPVVEAIGGDVGVRVVRTGGELIERMYVLEGSKERLVLTTPTESLAATGPRRAKPTALRGPTQGLYPNVPTLAMQTASVQAEQTGLWITLKAEHETARFTKRIWVPRKGSIVEVSLEAELPKPRNLIHSLLLSYAFVPDGKTLGNGGKPDATFLPGLRPGGDNVVGDHFFRAPAAVAQKGSLAAILMPDLDALADGREMETVIDLDAKSGVVDATLMSYGFCAHQLVGHVRYATNGTLVRSVPKTLRLKAEIMLVVDAEPYAAHELASKHLWNRYGHPTLEKVLPQAMWFSEYAEACYPAAFAEAYGENKLGWFETTIDGQVCGGIPAGWGFTEGWVSWQCWFNQLRSAWGLRWWGKRLGKADWVDKADKMLNLALAAPMDRGAVPTTYQSRQRQWKGSLITPSGECYYDLTNMAWKGIWLLRWANEFGDCPRKEEVLRQSVEMARYMVEQQNGDGSFPSWTSKDHRKVPILDASAQSALPVWFLAEVAALDGLGAEKGRFRQAAERGGAWLLKNVVDGRYYYDFETFFSCSPKQCLQVDGRADHERMRDAHSLEPPQNTLCMQWTAEALKALGGQKNLAGAMKALETMNLYQNVWSLPYRKTAYTYGGFGVQNSDGEYNDARQAQFGATLCDFGAELGRQDLFERGVAATRASMTLINHPLHANNGIYPNPNYPFGLQPENCCHGGSDHQAGRTGFDWGEGSGLASMAWLIHRYGQAYIDPKSGWSVGVDGVTRLPGQDGWASRLLSNVGKPQAASDIEVRVGSELRRQTVLKAPMLSQWSAWWPEASPRPQLAAQIEGHGVLDFVGTLVRKDGRTRPVNVRALAEQSGVIERAAAVAELPSDWCNTPLTLVGSARGIPCSFGPFTVWDDPSFHPENGKLEGWSVEGDFAEVPTFSERYDFGVNRGEGFIGTCEDGRGGFDDSFTGEIRSPEFQTTKRALRLLVGGGSGEGVYVELVRIRPDGAEERLAIARGTNGERMREVVWKLPKLDGARLQIRVVDKEKGGWGHVNVGRVRLQ